MKSVKFSTKTVGIIGMKGSGKTYYTRELAEALGKNCIIFDTIGALKVKSAQKYSANVGQMNCAKVEVRVTYTPSAGGATRSYGYIF